MNNIITNSLEKYSLKNSKLSGWKLCQKNENGNELIFTENSSVYHAVCGYKGEFEQAVCNSNQMGCVSLKLERTKRNWKEPSHFPTSARTFQLRSVLPNFALLFPTSLGSFQLQRNFPTALSNYTYPNQMSADEKLEI